MSVRCCNAVWNGNQLTVPFCTLFYISDCRVGGEAVHVLEPNKQELTARLDLGKWVGCVSCDNNEDWLVSGLKVEK